MAEGPSTMSVKGHLSLQARHDGVMPRHVMVELLPSGDATLDCARHPWVFLDQYYF